MSGFYPLGKGSINLSVFSGVPEHDIIMNIKAKDRYAKKEAGPTLMRYDSFFLI